MAMLISTIKFDLIWFDLNLLVTPLNWFFSNRYDEFHKRYENYVKLYI